MELDSWLWANAQGKPVSTSLADLRSLLSKGAIPPHTWVWQKGWRHWLPACRVQELTLALGDKARECQAPILDPQQTLPPKVPRRPESSADAPRLSTPVPPPPTVTLPFGRRPTAPTVNEELSQPRTTLRPPGAVPPPPRGIPRAMLGEHDDWDASTAETTSSLAPGSRSLRAPGYRTPSQVKLDASSPSAVVAPHQPPSGPFREPEIDVPDAEISAASHSTPEQVLTFDPDATPGHVGGFLHPTADAKGSTTTKPGPKLLTWVALGVALVSLSTGSWLVLRPASKSARERIVEPRATSKPKPYVCRVAATAERVSPRVSMSISPLALETLHANKVALGFAESANTATGISVDPEDLSVQFPYRDTQASKIVSVTPLSLGQSLSFVTVREGIELKQARAVADGQNFLFGVSKDGLARRIVGQPTEAVWPLEPGSSITDPRLVTNPGQGHAVAFRRGGQNGAIQLGVLTLDGTSKTPPQDVPTSASLLGTPSIALGSGQPRHVLIAFAGRASETQPWSLHLSRSVWGKPPHPATSFPLPKGGPGGDAISPSVTSLRDGHWLLQWSEGPAGERQVRVQLLDVELRPIADTYTVSPTNRNCGQGLLWSGGDRAVSFYIVSTGKQTELWATSLVCSK